MRRLTRRSTPPRDVERVWAACSLLLDYPTEELLANLDRVEALVPGHAGVRALVAHLRSGDVRRLQEEYVETFDHTRKCALYLTYYAYGDTRRRGAALVQVKQAYRDAGAVWDEECGELPDHLCAVLRLGAAVDVGAAWRMLNDYRVGLEMLRLALAAWRNHDGTVGSPWHGVVRAVCDTLPELAGDEVEAVRRLIAQGPPAEEVGLAGYGADPALDAAMAVRAGRALIAGPTIPVGVPR